MVATDPPVGRSETGRSMLTEWILTRLLADAPTNRRGAERRE
jgi:hypothetical protein